MGTIGYFILFAIIFITGKFIYDSYLTGNTEKKWAKFSNKENHEYNIKGTKFFIDGCYYYKLTKADKDYSMHLFLILNKNGVFVLEDLYEEEPIMDNNIETFREFHNLKEIDNEYSDNIGKYIIKNGKLSGKFGFGKNSDGTIDEMEYKELSCYFNGTKLLLTLYIIKYDLDLRSWPKKVLLEDVEMEFIPFKR